MNRREFLASTSAVAAASAIPTWGQEQSQIDSFPENVLRDSPYVEHDPIQGYPTFQPRPMRRFRT